MKQTKKEKTLNKIIELCKQKNSNMFTYLELILFLDIIPKSFEADSIRHICCNLANQKILKRYYNRRHLIVKYELKNNAEMEILND